MSKVVVDPAELRRFAHNLKRFSAELEIQMSALRGQLASLGQTWRDQEHDKFTAEFEETTRAVGHFLEATADHIPFLLRKADRVEDYLSQR